jgi:NADPH:quinone reductase-like Zn-dependent oxidoreductase
MRAIVWTKYGPPDVLQLKEVERPAPKDDEVQVRVLAASMNKEDWALIRGRPYIGRLLGFGLLKPKNKIPGHDIAGRVEIVGREVKRFRPGDEVFGIARGGFADYACAHEKHLVLKPATMSFEEAASAPIAGVAALEGLRDKGRIQQGQKVLVYGASGGVGTFAVQIAKSFGAVVTAVCSTRNLDMVRSIGADQVIDYTKEDFTKNGQRYDLILAANGYHSILKYRRSLNPKGICVVSGGSLFQIVPALLLGGLVSKIGSKKLRFFITRLNQSDLIFLRGLLEARKVVPVIDRCHPLSQTAEAVRYLEDEHAQGKVVLILERSD